MSISQPEGFGAGWSFFSNSGQVATTAADREQIAKWIANLSIWETKALVLHQDIEIPANIVKLIKKHPSIVKTNDGWDKLCVEVGKKSSFSISGSTKRCQKKGYNEYGNHLHELILKATGLRLDVKKETNKAFVNIFK